MFAFRRAIIRLRWSHRCIRVVFNDFIDRRIRRVADVDVFLDDFSHYFFPDDFLIIVIIAVIPVAGSDDPTTTTAS